MKKFLFLLPMIFLLWGCAASVGDQTKYLIKTVPCVPKRSSYHGNMLVSPVEALPMYNTTDMAYSKQPYQISYFSKNVWAETPPQMLQPLIVQTLQDTHYYHSVNSYPTIGNYDYILNTQILELEQKFYAHNVSFVTIRLRAQIMQAKTGTIIATKEFTVTRCAPQYSPLGGVIAANYATSDLLAQLARFCLRH